MSVNFERPVDEEMVSQLRKMFGDAVADDRKTFLFDSITEIRQSDMKEIANSAGQTVTVQLHGEGEIKTMSDGTRYRVTPDGWKKIEGED